MMGRGAGLLLAAALLGCGSAANNGQVASGQTAKAAPMAAGLFPLAGPAQDGRPVDHPNPERIVMLSVEDATARLQSDINVAPHKPSLPPSLESPPGHVHWGLYKACIDYGGVVFKVTTIKTATDQLDHDWSEVIRTWRFTPYAVDGQSTAFCYPVRIEIRVP
jgi:hypothetical protein